MLRDFKTFFTKGSLVLNKTTINSQWEGGYGVMDRFAVYGRSLGEGINIWFIASKFFQRHLKSFENYITSFSVFHDFGENTDMKRFE